MNWLIVSKIFKQSKMILINLIFNINQNTIKYQSTDTIGMMHDLNESVQIDFSSVVLVHFVP